MNKYKQWFNRKLATWRLKRHYEYLVEVDKLMEEFTTKTILDGGSQEFVNASRKQLINIQNDIKAKYRMMDFLNSV